MPRTRTLVVVTTLVLAACDGGAGAAPAQTPPPTLDTTTTVPATTTTTTPPDPFVYRLGLVEDLRAANFWAYFDPRSAPSDGYILGPTKPALYTYEYPGLELVPDLAAPGPVPEPVQDGDRWTVDVRIGAGRRWSDGTPITAADVVFTFETVRDLELRRGWLSAYPVVEPGDSALGLLAVEEVDTSTVRFVFNRRPGIPIWPHGPGAAPIMPRHFWTTAVERAKATTEPREALYAVSSRGEPSGGPYVIVDRIPGERIEALPNPHYHRRGDQVDSGGVTYTVGPHFDALEFHVLSDQRAAATALVDGRVDAILSPTGLDPSVAEFADAAPGVRLVRNPVNGFRYLGFNLREEPMSVKGFRDALAWMVDREFLADEVLQRSAFPVYTTIPAANPRWYDETQAETFAARYEDVTTEERLTEAVRALEEAGFTWERAPSYADNVVVPGEGIALDGEPVGELGILAPGPAYDPLRSTTALWVETWLSQLGFEARTELTDFTTLVERVFTPTSEGVLDFDMFVLGWRLPNPAMPVYHESFWAGKNDTLVNDGNNNTGFNDERFNGLVEEFDAADTDEEALDILWEMERILVEEKPYLLLFDTGITEAYRMDRVSYPSTDTLSGIQSVNGLPALVTPVR